MLPVVLESTFDIFFVFIAVIFVHPFPSTAMSNISGYALRRNGSCLSSEIDCGLTNDPFHACCPENTVCPRGQANFICCPNKLNCVNNLNRDCADTTANLYTADKEQKLEDQGFCCENGSYAFTDDDLRVGCASDEDYLDHSSLAAVLVSSATIKPTPSSTPLSSTASATVSTTTTQSPTPTNTEAKPASSTNTGAIAGGVVGGVAAVAILVALIWFFMRRRNKQQTDSSPVAPAYMNPNQPGAQEHFQPAGSASQTHAEELETKTNQPIAELSSGPGYR